MATNKSILTILLYILMSILLVTPIAVPASNDVQPYDPGAKYEGGDIVSNHGGLYECKGWPYSGWCGQVAYAPGEGSGYWRDAWIYLGEAKTNSEPVPALEPTPYHAGTPYEEGDIVINDGKLFKCKGLPYTAWCSNIGFEPGSSEAWEQAWIYVGVAPVEPVSPNPKDHPEYKDGNVYESGDIVHYEDRLYKCKGWPVTAWCGQPYWSPAGNYWAEAWEQLPEYQGPLGQVAITLTAPAGSSAINPVLFTINGESVSLPWGKRMLAATLIPGDYVIDLPVAGTFLPKLVSPSAHFGKAAITIIGNQVTELEVAYVTNAQFTNEIYLNRCSTCHRGGFSLDDVHRAERWLYQHSRAELVINPVKE